MDDLDLDDIDLENFNFDDVSNKNKQKKPQEQAAKPTVQNQNQNQEQKPVNNNANAADFENRPRLRKIKRPKFHTGPINDPSSPALNNDTALNKPSPTESYPEHRAPMPETGGGLIRASDRTIQPQTTNQFTPTNLDIQQNPYNNYVTDEDEFVYQGNDNVIMGKTDNKKALIVAFVCLIIGMFMGKIFFSSEQVVHNGLQGVVVNPEVPNGRARCGLAERTQGCVLYIMNPQRQDLNGRDFYDLAAQLTGRQRFVIETGNMRYSSVKIRPGSIAQLNIPPLQ